ncbi:C40 family peptidase [Lutimonas halocynthiae]|uniref:C40 family peptidase n=1 Tax=Lutimonas halocynthiae TaxID=1446477 RepID=UPI0025B60297|nr:C40 family peptidase [Lutimonas halocynthiae]MDN3644321.1 C40 family peptidase [Lutimonas halocynthiae]
MRSFYYTSLTAVLIGIMLTSCQKPTQNVSDIVYTISDSIKKVYAPDKRVAIYDLQFELENDKLIVSGETDQEKALTDLVESLSRKGIKIENQTTILPDASVGSFYYAVVNNSVANIRSNPKHSGELATQAILGMPLKVLKIDGDFYLVQTPDAYISWVDHGGVTLLTRAQFESWNKSPKIIFTNTFGFVYKEPHDELHKISDIVMGAQLSLLEETKDYYKVGYPDKRQGYLKKSESQVYENWIANTQASGSLIELYAKELLGVPYLWGGTSTKGMDCSGFTKTVYLMNGYVIPRDASQQIMAGENVDPELAFNNLQKGDLMFFGKKATDSTRQRVTHVGIWLDNGQGEFIHASGRVKMGSINSESSLYDEHNTNRYLGSRRYLNITDKLISDLKTTTIRSVIKS